MPNTKDMQTTRRNYIAIGGTGAGKTALFTTIPGRKFMYIFDSNSLPTLQNSSENIEYETFFPDKIPLDLISLKTKEGIKRTNVVPGEEPHAYPDLIEDIDRRIDSGFFDDIDVVGFDGLTNLQCIAMDQLQYLNDRFGRWPQQDDYSPVITAVGAIFRSLTTIVSTFLHVHHEYKQDEKSKKMWNHPVAYGKLRVALPVMFSEIFLCSCQSTPGKDGTLLDKFEIQTRPDDLNPTIRTTMQGLNYYEDVTITDWSDPTQFGIGALLKKETQAAKPAKKEK